MDKKLYSIGEFAKLVDVKRQTLLWYDEIDLFKPYEISEKGYRYYTLDQLENFSVIRNLKDLGISLEKIKEIIEFRTPTTMQKIFKEQISTIDTNISQLERQKTSLSNWSQLIDRLHTLPLDTVFIEYQDAASLLVSHNLTDLPEESRSLEITKLNEYRSQSAQIAESLGGIVSLENFNNNQTIYDYFYLPAYHPADNYTKQAGYFVSIYYQGDYTQTFHVYQKIRDFADENELELGAKIFEQSQVGELTASNPEAYITKISVPIKSHA